MFQGASLDRFCEHPGFGVEELKLFYMVCSSSWVPSVTEFHLYFTYHDLFCANSVILTCGGHVVDKEFVSRFSLDKLQV